ncbi:hypothetical protein JCM33774_40530 [Actinophytocola sp. KF-1]
MVSNNSCVAVETYLDIHDLRAFIDVVSARASADVTLLKPSPFLVAEAIGRLDVAASQSVLVGESTTDVQAAHAASVRVSGYANRPAKIPSLDAHEPDVITTSMDLFAYL